MTLSLETILTQYHQQRDAELAAAVARHTQQLCDAISFYKETIPTDIQAILTDPDFTYDSEEGEITAQQAFTIFDATIIIWIYTYIGKGGIFIAVSESQQGRASKRRLDTDDDTLANWPLALGEIIHWELQRIKLNQTKPQTASIATNHAVEAVGLLNLAAQIENENTSAYVATVALANAAVAQLEQSRRIADALEYLNHIDNGPFARIADLTEQIADALDLLSQTVIKHNGAASISIMERFGR